MKATQTQHTTVCSDRGSIKSEEPMSASTALYLALQAMTGQEFRFSAETRTEPRTGVVPPDCLLDPPLSVYSSTIEASWTGSG